MEKVNRLLEWMYSLFTKEVFDEEDAQEFAEQFTCEALPYDQVPNRYYKQLVAFRHLNKTRRVSVCKTFLRAKKTDGVLPTGSPSSARQPC